MEKNRSKSRIKFRLKQVCGFKSSTFHCIDVKADNPSPQSQGCRFQSCPGEMAHAGWSHHPWKCPENTGPWHLRAGFGAEHGGGAGLTMTLDDLKGLLQPLTTLWFHKKQFQEEFLHGRGETWAGAALGGLDSPSLRCPRDCWTRWGLPTAWRAFPASAAL